MSYEVQHMTEHWAAVKLVSSADFKTQQTGKTYGNVTTRYKSAGNDYWSSLTMTTQNWREIGNGFYEVRFAGVQPAGRFDYQVECAGCLDHNGRFFVVGHEPTWGMCTIVDKASGAEQAAKNALKTLVRAVGTVVLADSETSAESVDFWDYPNETQLLRPGDRIYWRGIENNALGFLTRVVSYDSGRLTWTPALPAVPQTDWEFYVLQRGYYDDHRVSANVGYDGVSLVVNCWLERSGRLVQSVGDCAVSVYDDAGVEQFVITQETPDAQGVFRLARENPDLVAGKSYYAKAELVNDGLTHMTVTGVTTI